MRFIIILYNIFILPFNMFLIKQSIITTIILHKIINFIKKSPTNASKIGKEISIFYHNVYNCSNDYYHNDSSRDLNKIYNYIFYHLINQLNKNYKMNISLKNILFINSIRFFKKFNLKLFKLKKNLLYSYFRGYYINHLLLYSTNITRKNIQLYDTQLYFVLYDFNSIYLEYIYKDIISSIIFQPKIKFLLNTYNDKYSINDLTDNIPYKLVFLHKTKYYYNIITKFLSLLFYNDDNLNEEELEVCKFYDLML